MKQLLRGVAAFMLLAMTSNFALAQHHNEHNKRANPYRRVQRQCMEPFPENSFLRDYPALRNNNLYHLDQEIRAYTQYRCLTSDQIRRLAAIYPTDRGRLEYLTFAFRSVFDMPNYAIAGTSLANQYSRGQFYQFLLKVGIPANAYYNDYYATVPGGTPPPPPYPIDPRYNNGSQAPPQYDNNGQPPYNGSQVPPQYGNNGQPPYNGSQVPPQYGNNGQPPYNGSQVPPQYGNNGQPPYNGSQVPPQYGNNQSNSNSTVMSLTDFEALKAQLKQTGFESKRLDVAKASIINRSLTSAQVAEILQFFEYDTNKFDLAKFAYDSTYDRYNYGVVSATLQFQKNRDDLQAYIQQRRQ